MRIEASQVSHLESAIDATRLESGVEHTVHAGRPVWVRYDLERVRRTASPELWHSREPGLWRYRELLPLPLDASPVSLGEGMTPLVQAARLGRELGVEDLWIKDESRLPTGSFKDRGMAMAVNMAVRFGRRRLAVPTNGNAGGSLAAYAAAAGVEAFIVMPGDTPRPNVAEAVRAGARAYLVDGLIGDCARAVRELVEAYGCFDLSTLREPYRIEGKKTMGLELWDQCGGELPDVIVYPTGGGTGLIGMWKAFLELRELGWLAPSAKLPRMVVVQSDGCAPIVRAFAAGERFASPWEGALSSAPGIRVASALGDFMILDAVRESGGTAVAVEDSRIPEFQRLACRSTGLAVCPEGGAAAAAVSRLVEAGWLRGPERVVVFNTASAHKYECVLEPPRTPAVIDLARPLLEQIGETHSH